MKHIIIIGENSYIGSALQAYLERQPESYAVKTFPAIDRSPDSFDFRGADVVVNVAAIVHRKETKADLPLYEKVNYTFAVQTAQKAKADGTALWIQFSTMSIYGKIVGVITKDTAPHPVTAYGQTKLMAERGIAVLSDEHFRVSILRPPMVFGSGAKGNYHTLEKLTDILPFSPTFENKRTLVSIDTLCACVRERIDDPRSGVFFPQEPQPVSTADLIDRIATLKGRDLRKTSFWNPAIRLLRATTSIGKKAFGDLLYENLWELPLSAVFAEEMS